jgi:geranylgeranyl reductase family protein
MSPARDAEVIIVGAGPAGCATGIELAAAGVRVRVLDRARFPRDKTCGDAISNGAVAALDALGCGAALRAAPHALVRAADARFPDGTSIRRHYDSPGMIVPRLALDDALRRCREDSGVELEQNVKVRELLGEGGRVIGVSGSFGSLYAPLVIAADGYGSIAWPRLGRPAAQGASLAVSVRAYYSGVAYPDGAEVSEHCFLAEVPHGYAWVFPEVAGRANVGVYQRGDAFAKGRDDLVTLLDQFVASRPDRFASAQRQSEPKSWPLPLAVKPQRISAPGLLAIGDAGRFVDPLSGEGIWQALHTGRLAARVARQALEAGALTPALQLRYELECARSVRLPSAGKALVQQGITGLVSTGLYRNPLSQAALRWGYGGRLLEMTKR